MFVTTLVFAKLVTWMRGQSGTSDLRALAYMDEVAGYVPPTAAPPAKKPILTILKQGRAFGLGLVLSTQNPVDLDYKAMSNAGTWLVGRLQTENDKARVLEGLRSAAGGADISALDSSIGALQKRQFMLVSAKDSRPRVFSTRWAMSYLRGPLTKEQVQQLMSGAARPVEAAPAPAAADAATAQHAEPAPAAPLAADETSVAPAAAAGVTVSYLDPAAPWAAQVGATAGVDAPARLHRHPRRRCATTTPRPASTSSRSSRRSTGRSTRGLDLDSETVVDFDDRDFRPDAPAGATYVLPAAPIGEAKFFAQAGKDVQARLVANRALEIFRNKQLKLTSRPGETEEAFLAALRRGRPGEGRRGDGEAERAPRGEEGPARRTRSSSRSAGSRSSTRRRSRGRRTSSSPGAGAVLGALFGGKRSARSITNAVGSVASKHGQTATASRAARAPPRRRCSRRRTICRSSSRRSSTR